MRTLQRQRGNRKRTGVIGVSSVLCSPCGRYRWRSLAPCVWLSTIAYDIVSIVETPSTSHRLVDNQETHQSRHSGPYLTSFCG
ncbi:hypothetical protein BOTBODRAFT_30247 [Botryobasidium botryosum FD-172 SS1]|uniref:Uncharacterized protein n=1 Tax=Botryobasidium botryosum (strain FD-172 SS1) TaxID=930990 RepID=A0A067MYD1_BOTB1|nr:hypothetical protein BOTBODRAFT_30247 [Botryobasidium botryosum FD-172 SS1]